jgi:hypothetical protein
VKEKKEGKERNKTGMGELICQLDAVLQGGFRTNSMIKEMTPLNERKLRENTLWHCILVNRSF